MPLAVELDGVDFAYVRGQPVLRDVDLRVAEGEFVAIAGPNGGGKTTLLRVALGLERPTSGRVLLFGEPADSLRDRWRIGYLAQRTRIGAHAPATVREIVEAGRAPLRPYGRLRADDRAAVAEAIEHVGLGGLARRPLRELSGGQQQRAFIAKALAARPSLLVLDEPTTGVDVGSQEALGELLSGCATSSASRSSTSRTSSAPSSTSCSGSCSCASASCSTARRRAARALARPVHTHGHSHA